MKLFFEAIFKFILGVLMVVLLLFLPAETFGFWNAWLLMGLLFIPMFIAGIILMIKNPDLLRKRLDAKEKEGEQKKVIGMSAIIFILGFVLAGLDFRNGWTNIPLWVVISASVIFIISYILYAEVLRENTYLSRTIEVQENQKVIDTGLYGIVRHPMYFATTLLFLSFPIILGSWISFAIFCLFPFLLIKRIKNEEEVLEKGLEGYKEYKQKVKYRMIPFIW
ncbi:MAG: isoprenylcysteine carboxylmethyltransferase family protein [Clostridia bacterium]|nr:isoprenylcysteine carboxylmethyltransferase family protein [Clostridia bacterium]